MKRISHTQLLKVDEVRIVSFLKTFHYQLSIIPVYINYVSKIRHDNWEPEDEAKQHTDHHSLLTGNN